MLLVEGNNVGAQDLAMDLPLMGLFVIVAKIRHFVTWIALADSLLTLMYNYLV